MDLKPYLFTLIFIISGCIGTDVLEEEILSSKLKISSTVNSLKVGDSFQLDYVYFNETGEMENVSVVWSSSDDHIISVSPEGIATAINPGEVYVYARFEELVDSLLIVSGDETVLNNVRTGEFSGRNNYNVSGNFSLMFNDDSQLVLQFADNFEASNGPGLYVYLSNSDQSVSGAYEVGPLKSNNGAQEYVLPQNITINMYDYVIIYCKPFGIIFGDGKFN